MCIVSGLWARLVRGNGAVFYRADRRFLFEILLVFFLVLRQPPGSTLFPYTTLFRSSPGVKCVIGMRVRGLWTCGSSSHCTSHTLADLSPLTFSSLAATWLRFGPNRASLTIAGESPSDRKSTRLNSSHITISYAVFCL